MPHLPKLAALSLAALAASGAGAARPQIDNEGHAFITMELFGAHAGGKGERLQVFSVEWGEWIADVERPRAASGWAKADGLGVSWDVPDSPGSAGRANDRLRSAGPKDGWPAAGRGIDIATIDGEAVNPSSSAGKQPKTRPMVLVPGGTMPRASASGGITKVDSFTVKQTVKQVRPIGTSDLTMKRGASATGENVQGSQDIVITGSRIPQPNLNTQEPASMRVKVRFPWLACEEGRSFRSLTIGDEAGSYALSDAVIADCGTGAERDQTISFNYKEVQVRGWDPEKKEQ